LKNETPPQHKRNLGLSINFAESKCGQWR